MLDPKFILKKITEQGVNFFTGVPDSLLKDLCFCIEDISPEVKHTVAANEGSAVALAAGHNIASGSVPVVYLQNSGLGNAINPLLSLSDPAVYGIPTLLFIGWRGESGVNDEPQHVKQGSVTKDLLSSVGIQYEVLSQECNQAVEQIEKAFYYMAKEKAPFVFLVRKNTFSEYIGKSKHNYTKVFTREKALEIAIDNFDDKTVFVGTTGKLSRELYELREKRKESHGRDFLTVGSMGHASQIALGIAEERPSNIVVCLDGDGSILMHLGGMATVGSCKPNNFVHIVINNGVHDSVGGQCVTGNSVEYILLAESLGYQAAFSVGSQEEFVNILKETKKLAGPIMVDCKVDLGSRSDLGRPKESPQDNIKKFRNFLSK